MLSVLLTILVIIPVAWLIAKRYNPQLSIAFGGVALLLLATMMGTGPDGSKTGFFLFDIFKIWADSFKKVGGGLGMAIMLVGAYAMYMDHIDASKSLVKIAVKPLQAIQAPYLVMMLTYVTGQLLNMFIPSASGLALLLMVTAYPILTRLGVSKLSATAVIATTGCLDLGPASGNTILGAKIVGMDVAEFFVQYQLKVGLVAAVAIALTHYIVQKRADIKNDMVGDGKTDSADEGIQSSAPAFYALLPLIPLLLIFTFSKLVVTSVKMDIYTAMIISMFITILVEILRTRDLKAVLESYKVYLDRMGKQFASVVSLIVAGSVLAAGLKAIGSIDFLIDSAVAAGLPAFILIAICVLIIASAAFLMGSGNAAFFSFAELIPGIASKIGVSTVSVIVPMQLASGLSRTMSPIAGAVVASAGISGVSPFDVVKRTIPPMLVGLVVSTVTSYLMF